MGVKGTYLSTSIIKKITKKVNLKDYNGKTGAIDTSKFLHAGCLIDPRSIAIQQHEGLVEGGRDAESIPVDHTVRQMKKLGTNFGINAFAVIDGRALPAKEEENAQRQKERKEAYTAAKAAEAKEEFALATKMYFKACGTSPRMRQLLADECAQNDIPYVKAPYEADAQMVQAVEDELASFIISEDADMLALGSTCTIFKINFKDGTGQEVTQERLFNDEGSGFKDFTLPMLVQQNILQGNDYSKGVDGFGIKTALELVKDHKTLDSVLAALRQQFEVEEDEQLLLPNGFSEEMLLKAYYTMYGYPVFKMTEDGYEISNLNPIPPNIADRFPFLRLNMSSQVAAGLASGFLDEETKQPYEDVLSFNDEEEAVDASSSAKQERIRREAAEYERMKKWLKDGVDKLRADPEKYAETKALFERLKEENEARVTALDKNDSYRVVYEKYQYAAECRMLELKSKLPANVSADQIDEMIALAKDQCMVIALEYIIHEDGTIRDAAAIVNACKYMPDPNRCDLPKKNEMTASLWSKVHSPYLVKNTGSDTGEHFSQKEVHVVGTGDPTEDTILQVHQIVCHQSKGDVQSFLLEQVQGEFFRECLGGTGYAMNRCVSGVVRDPGGLTTHACGVLVILDPLSKLRDGSVGISNYQSLNNMIDIKQNLPKCIKLLRCTTMRATSSYYGGQGAKTPIPYVISTALPPTDESVVHISKTAEEMKSIVKGNNAILREVDVADGKLVISQGQGLPDIYVIPFRVGLGLKYSPGQTAKPNIKRLLEQRNSSCDIPILLTTSEDPNVGIITITEGTMLAHELIRTKIIRTTLSQDKLRVGPMLVLNWEDKGIEIWAHLFDPEISPGKPGEVFNKLIYNALLARNVTKGPKSKGAISVFRSKQDANNHLPIITGPSWGSRNVNIRGAIGANHSGVNTSEALAGKEISCAIGNAYTRQYEEEDGHLDEKNITLFYQRAIEHCPNLVDKLKKYPDTLCVGKSESQCEPELLHKHEQPSAASIAPPPGRETRSTRKRRSSGSNGENDQPNSPQKSRRSRRRTEDCPRVGRREGYRQRLNISEEEKEDTFDGHGSNDIMFDHEEPGDDEKKVAAVVETKESGQDTSKSTQQEKAEPALSNEAFTCQSTSSKPTATENTHEMSLDETTESGVRLKLIPLSIKDDRFDSNANTEQKHWEEEAGVTPNYNVNREIIVATQDINLGRSHITGIQDRFIPRNLCTITLIESNVFVLGSAYGLTRAFIKMNKPHEYEIEKDGVFERYVHGMHLNEEHLAIQVGVEKELHNGDIISFYGPTGFAYLVEL